MSLRIVHVSHWRRAPLQTLLPVLGVAIGVAAIVAIGVGSKSTIESFRWTMQRLEGRATHQLLPGATPLPLALAFQLDDLEGVAAAAPVLSAYGLAGEVLTIYGIDSFAEADLRQLGLTRAEGGQELFRRFLSHPGALVLSSPYLARRGLAVGDSFELVVGARRSQVFALAALPERVDELEVPDNLALCDVATAAELSGAPGLTRIDLIVDAEQPESVLKAIRALAPLDAELAQPGGRATHMRNMLAALQANLRALSYLSLFVALFLIYNALLLATLRRRSEIGILRCLGATPEDVQRAWLLEGLLLGLIGSALGIGLGMVGAGFVLRGFAQSAGDLYEHVGAVALRPSWIILAQATFVGVGTSLLGAFGPARQAARIAPAHAGMRSVVEYAAQRRLRGLWIAALCGLGIAALALWLPLRTAWPGFVAAMAIAGSGAILSPWASDRLLRALRPWSVRWLGLLPTLALDNIQRGLSRTGLAIATLTVALAMSIAMSAMVESFRREMQDWIAATVRADVYVSPLTSEVDFLGSHLDPSLLAQLRALPEVVAVDAFRGAEAQIGDLKTTLGAVDIAVLRRRATPILLSGPSITEYFDRLQAGEVGVSEALMRKAGLRPGETLRLRARGRDLAVRIAGVTRDYSSDRGFVLMDARHAESLLGAMDINSLALYLQAGADVEAFVEQLQAELAAEHALHVRSQRALRENANLVFNRTFAVARALEALGVAVASIGILSALLALLLERGRELALLRALGMTRPQLAALLALESGCIAGLSWLFALPLGAGLAWILLHVIQERSFGWSLPLRAPAAGWGESLIWALLAAALATLLPIGRAWRLAVARALRQE